MPNDRKVIHPAKRGRPKDPLLELARQLFPDVSERSLARWVRGTKMMDAAGVPQDVRERITQRCTTARGGFQFATFEQAAEDVAAAHVVARDEAV
jgi:hypothetical protein